MIKFLFARLLQASIVMLVISFIAFAVQSKLGDPVSQLVAITASAEEKATMRDQLGLDDPFLIQYGRFLKNAVQGDFGTSYFFKEPTTKVILDKLPATLELVFIASLFIVFVSIPLGVYTAIRPNSVLTKFIMGLSIVGISVPVFLTAILMINVFSLYLGWLPSYGRGETSDTFGWQSGLFTVDGLKHLIMPSLALSSIMLPLFIRLVRSEMIEALSSEYIRFSYAKGIKEKTIWYSHALKNTMLPVITVGGVQLGIMVAYTILTETVFQWPGVGLMFLEAVNRADIPLLTTYIIFVGLLFVVTNTIIDLIYGLIDPRVNLLGGK
ncbi:ABC transporter permease [Ostreibacterium oceani]|uniref:ABC transporter permease subunit n=1 Tax=Ostreibacterium oceani TaxID=2654998 RepID=A0A6N7F195_9GAMM|nr:ABC transporter permease [Ostreibacterium oceani]MPV85626.1 ABC transporter permease subunit [Ostreibacterium oceani]